MPFILPHKLRQITHRVPMVDQRARSFGAVADTYDRVRPGYPIALVTDVLDFAGGPAEALEIGAGTGKATRAFAQVARGLTITALEPDPAMSAVLTRRLDPGWSVTVKQ